MAKKPCLTCGRITRSGSRCTPCQAPLLRSPQSRAAGRLLVKRHRMVHGNLCPGWERDPHLADSLVADHAVPLVRGGPDILSNLQVLCPSCNLEKGDAIGYVRLGD